MKSVRARAAGFAALLLVSSAPAGADSASTGVPIDEVTVHGSVLPTYELPLRRTGAHVTVIDAEEIERSGATTLPQILREKAGFVVYDQNGNAYEGVTGLRGFNGGDDLAVVVDGVRVNDPNGNFVAWNLIPLERIERVEVIRGGATPLFGRSALSGVVRITTKRARETGGSLALAAASHAGRRLLASYDAATDRWDLAIGATLEEGKGFRENAGLRYADVSGKGVWRVGRGRFGIDFQVHQDRLYRAAELNDAELRADRTQSVKDGDFGDFEQNRAVLSFVHPLLGGEVEARAHYREFDRITRSTSRTFGTVSQTTTEVDAAGGVLEWSRRFARHGVTLFLDGRRDKDDAVTQSLPAMNVTADQNLVERQRSAGARVDLGLLEDLTLTGNARFDDFRLSNENRRDRAQSGSRAFEAWSGGGALVFHPDALGPNGRVYVSAYRSFQPPTASELFSFFAGFSQPNPNLRPEKTRAIEAGFALARARWDAGASVFRITTDDEIIFDNADAINKNIGKTRRDGIEVYVGVRILPGLAFRSEATWIDAEVQRNPDDPSTVGKDLPQVSPFAVTNRLRWDRGRHWAEITHRFVGRRPMQSDDDNDKPFLESYHLFDVGLGRRVRDDLEIGLRVENLFDREYNDRGIDAFGGPFFNPAAGRTFAGWATWRF